MNVPKDKKREIQVLVVDDYALTRDMVHSILKNSGFGNVIQADNGTNAIERLKDQKVGLIICDWNMPSTSGVEVLRWVRKQPSYANVPFIMLTAEAYRENVAAAMSAGVTDYVVKPFTHQVLIEKVEKALGLVS